MPSPIKKIYANIDLRGLYRVIGLSAPTAPDEAVRLGDLSAVASSGNYNDLNHKPTLGNSASRNVGTTAGTVAAGDDSRLLPVADPLLVIPHNPTAVTSPGYKMLGLGSLIKITPIRKPCRIRVVISGYPSGTGTSSLNSFKLAHGTGHPPANGDAATGTVISVTRSGGSVVSANQTSAVIIWNVILDGLDPGTEYWFDVQASVGLGNTNATINSIEATVEELM